MYQALPFGEYGFGIAVGVIGIMIAISGIIFGVGYAIDDRRLKDFGKGELLQSIINGALVGSMLLLFAGNGIVTGIVNSVAQSSNVGYSCPAYMDANAALCFAYSYLIGTGGYSVSGTQYSSLFVTISGLLLALLTLSTVLGVIAAVKINLLVITFSFSSILTPILSELQYITNIVSTLAVGITVQAALVSFIAVTAVSVLLPVGLILRSLYATRKLGGFFIAASIGTYVVLPLTYLLNATMVGSYSLDVNSTSLQQITSAASSAKGELLGGGISQNSSSGIVGSISDSLQGVVGSINGYLAGLFSALSRLIMQVFILPAFSLIVTGISIRELASLFGSEAFFGKFKII
ncbi:MAG: hypothetical protein KGH59_03855 [Candidatus Micrarchaeota archaeon]|nr:hypothetical protein [Candidatus Micrarchaeota archaeon]